VGCGVVKSWSAPRLPTGEGCGSSSGVSSGRRINTRRGQRFHRAAQAAHCVVPRLVCSARATGELVSSHHASGRRREGDSNESNAFARGTGSRHCGRDAQHARRTRLCFHCARDSCGDRCSAGAESGWYRRVAASGVAQHQFTVARVLLGMRAVVEAERAAGSEPCVAATLVQLRTTCFRETSQRVAFLLPAAAPPVLAQGIGLADNATGRNSPQHYLAEHWHEWANGTMEAWYGTMLAVRDAYVLQRPAREPPRQRSGFLCGGRGVVVDVTTATVCDVSNGGHVPGDRDMYEAGDVLHVPIAVHNGIVAEVSQYHTNGFFHAVTATPVRLLYARGLAMAGEVDVLRPALAFKCKQRPYARAAVANLGFEVLQHGDGEIEHSARSAAVSAIRSAPRERKHARVLLQLHSVADLVIVPPERPVAIQGMLAALRAAMLETAPSGDQCDASPRPSSCGRPSL
jgi:hypothetical protein